MVSLGNVVRKITQNSPQGRSEEIETAWWLLGANFINLVVLWWNKIIRGSGLNLSVVRLYGRSEQSRHTYAQGQMGGLNSVHRWEGPTVLQIGGGGSWPSVS